MWPFFKTSYPYFLCADTPGGSQHDISYFLALAISIYNIFVAVFVSVWLVKLIAITNWAMRLEIMKHPLLIRKQNLPTATKIYHKIQYLRILIWIPINHIQDFQNTESLFALKQNVHISPRTSHNSQWSTCFTIRKILHFFHPAFECFCQCHITW